MTFAAFSVASGVATVASAGLLTPVFMFNAKISKLSFEGAARAYGRAVRDTLDAAPLLRYVTNSQVTPPPAEVVDRWARIKFIAPEAGGPKR